VNCCLKVHVLSIATPTSELLFKGTYS